MTIIVHFSERRQTTSTAVHGKHEQAGGGASTPKRKLKREAQKRDGTEGIEASERARQEGRAYRTKRRRAKEMPASELAAGRIDHLPHVPMAAPVQPPRGPPALPACGGETRRDAWKQALKEGSGKIKRSTCMYTIQHTIEYIFRERRQILQNVFTGWFSDVSRITKILRVVLFRMTTSFFLHPK